MSAPQNASASSSRAADGALPFFPDPVQDPQDFEQALYVEALSNSTRRGHRVEDEQAR